MIIYPIFNISPENNTILLIIPLFESLSTRKIVNFILSNMKFLMRFCIR